MKKSIHAQPVVVFLCVTTLVIATAAADIVCPDSSYCTVSFTNPTRNRITVVPNVGGDTFAGTGITIRVFLKNCNGAPLVGVPAQEVVIFNSALCICPGGNIADAATDANGMTTFAGTIRAGGCVESLTIVADGVAICTRNDLKTCSPDRLPSSPCYIDSSDLGAMAVVLGSVARYTTCLDFNQSGPPTVDAGDLVWFASALGAACR